jgi:hypothetical protein
MKKQVKKYRPPRTADELVERYAKGERRFPRTNLRDESIDADLPGIDLNDSTLRGVMFGDIHLEGASFRRADAAFNIFDANLEGADFHAADLSWSNFGWSNLTNANLHGANLRHAQFMSGRLEGCNFTRASLDETSFLDVSLVSLCHAEGVAHHGPSYVDHRTVMRSLGSANVKDVLLRMGMPAIFVEYMVDCAHSTGGSIFSLLQSTFLSYGAPDEAFAQRLYEALHANGVRTFFFGAHAVPGKKLHRLMREGVNEYDRVVLICSKASLSRKGVLNEIEETLQREARDGGASYLIPIRIDDYVLNEWSPADRGLAQTIRDRVVADFTRLDVNPGKFERSLQMLITALKRELPKA